MQPVARSSQLFFHDGYVRDSGEEHEVGHDVVGIEELAFGEGEVDFCVAGGYGGLGEGGEDEFFLLEVGTQMFF